MRRLLSTSICIQLALVTFVREGNKSRKKVYCHPLADVTGWLVCLDDLRQVLCGAADLFDAALLVGQVLVSKVFIGKPFVFGVG